MTRDARHTGTHRVPGLRAQISAAEVNDWNTLAKRQQTQGSVNLKQSGEEQQAWYVWLRNNTPDEHDRFSCVSLGEPIVDYEEDGSTDLIFELEAPDPDKTPAILLNGVGTGGELQKAVIHGLALAKVIADTGASELLGTMESNGEIKQRDGGNITLLQTPTGTAAVRPVLLGVQSGSASVGLFKTPAGGIPAATGTGTTGDPYQFGTADCLTVNSTTGVVGTGTEEIANIISGDTIAGDVVIKAVKVSDVWIVDVASCPA